MFTDQLLGPLRNPRRPAIGRATTVAETRALTGRAEGMPNAPAYAIRPDVFGLSERIVNG